MPITITITTEVERLMDLHDMIPFLIDSGIPESDIVLGGHESPQLFIVEPTRDDAHIQAAYNEVEIQRQRIAGFEADMAGMVLMLAEVRAERDALQAEKSARIRDEAEERDYADWRMRQTDDLSRRKLAQLEDSEKVGIITDQWATVRRGYSDDVLDETFMTSRRERIIECAAYDAENIRYHSCAGLVAAYFAKGERDRAYAELTTFVDDLRHEAERDLAETADRVAAQS